MSLPKAMRGVRGLWFRRVDVLYVNTGGRVTGRDTLPMRELKDALSKEELERLRSGHAVAWQDGGKARIRRPWSVKPKVRPKRRNGG